MIVSSNSFEPPLVYEGEVAGESYFGLPAPYFLPNIVNQGNPAQFALSMPGERTRLLICLPSVCVVRLYLDGVGMRNLVCESSDPRYKPHPKICYRVNMHFAPWMFVERLPESRQRRINKEGGVANYVILNALTTDGYAGIVIRVARAKRAADDWLEIHRFSMSDRSQFADWQSNPHTKLLARFEPKEVNTRDMHWASVTRVAETA